MLNTAVIGTGSMGKNHARVYSELSESNLVAIAEVSEEGKDIAKRFKCKHYTDYVEMLNSEDIDALSICVPTSLHKSVSLNCIDEGKHILIEKPIAARVEDAKEILEAARKREIIVTVGHIERFNPAVQKLKEVIEEKLGDTTSIIARRVGIFPPQIKDANVITDLAVHDIDVFNYLLGKQPKEVYVKSGDALKSGREDHAIITLSYEGTDCVVQVNWITPVKVRELAVTGTKGYAELNYITQELRIFETSYEKGYDSFGDFILKFGAPNEITVEVDKVEPLKSELSHFLECIKKQKEPLVTAEDGLTALYIATKAVESYESGKPIKLG
jgi:UDP-N-acetylglucosamine 3-dehydrogenase